MSGTTILSGRFGNAPPGVCASDAPQIAEQTWHHGFPSGPAGRFGPYLPFYWTTWKFSKAQAAADWMHTRQP